MAKKPTRLRFTEDDLADSHVKKAADRADKAADKAEKAVDKLASKKKTTNLRLEKDAAGSRKAKLRFEKADITEIERPSVAKHMASRGAAVSVSSRAHQAVSEYDAKYSKWTYADLPIFPMDWKYEVSSGTKKQFGILKKLMAREDVASLVCATDAGREGELIFRLVYHKAGCRKPFERLWISSMEDVAIKEGFENLRSGTEYDALYEAALCRERADWIVGINATRLFSTFYGQTLNVGRVMTPTLAMAVMREAAIAAFKPEPFYTVQIGLDGFTASSERYKKKPEAEAVCKGCSVATVTKAERTEKSEKPPHSTI